MIRQIEITVIGERAEKCVVLKTPMVDAVIMNGVIFYENPFIEDCPEHIIVRAAVEGILNGIDNLMALDDQDRLDWQEAQEIVRKKRLQEEGESFA